MRVKYSKPRERLRGIMQTKKEINMKVYILRVDTGLTINGYRIEASCDKEAITKAELLSLPNIQDIKLYSFDENSDEQGKQLYYYDSFSDEKHLDLSITDEA